MFTIIAILLTVCLYLIAGFASATLLSVFLLFTGIAKYLNGKKSFERLNHVEPSIMKCPNCGGLNVKIESVKTGNVVNAYGYKGIAGVRHSTTYQRKGKCQDCGFDYDYITVDDIYLAKEQAEKQKESGIIYILVSLAIAVLLIIFAIRYK